MATDLQTESTLTIGTHTLNSRLIVGTGKYASHALMGEALDRSGYINEVTAESNRNNIRRLVRRLALSDRDVKVWLGMLRQILWKLRQQ